MEVKEIPIDQIRVSVLNTRKDLGAGNEDSSIEDLAGSIKEKGLLNPVMVRLTSRGDYESGAGQRRFLAGQKLGWSNIPALIRSDVADRDATAISLIENVHRAAMNPLDKSHAFAALRDGYDGDLQRVSKETGIGLATIKRYLALLSLPPQIQHRISTAEGPSRIEAMSLFSRKPEEPRAGMAVPIPAVVEDHFEVAVAVPADGQGRAVDQDRNPAVFAVVFDARHAVKIDDVLSRGAGWGVKNGCGGGPCQEVACN